MAGGTPPSWISGAIFYQIFPDRFAMSPRLPKPNHLEEWDSPPTPHGFKGGDLLGVVEHLDYLQELGINAIYFNPLFQSTANHRYHTYDYYHIDPLLGGNDAFRTLLAEAHRRDMRVVLDGVFNHTGRGFYQFNHILENGPASPYLDWYHVRGFPLRAYEKETGGNYGAWWGLSALPKLNTDNMDVREFLWGVGRHWIEQGVDGWRLDVPNEIDDDAFWEEFQCRVKDANPNAYIVGEIWGDGTRWLLSGQFDATMNYQFTRASLGFFLADTLDESLTAGLSYAPVPRLDAPGFRLAIDSLLKLYPNSVNYSQFNLMDSHDTARLLSLAKGDERAVTLAVLFQMTYVGAPCIYYGDEIGLTGGRDPDCRGSMTWDSRHWNHYILDTYKRYIGLRRERRALRDGSYRPLYAEGRAIVFGRRHESETVVVALNAARDTARVDVAMEDYLPEGAVLRQIWTGEIVRVTQGKLMGLTLPPQSGAVFDVVTQE